MTAIRQLLGIELPIIQAPMAGVQGSELAIAVSNAEQGAGRLTRGDAAILKFLAAAELIEADLWQQYAELGVPRTPTSSLCSNSTAMARNTSPATPSMNRVTRSF
jgi:NAD(P)H-dependent flavin oxidoreductase YrpB (nitropropane dioxygenase family)